MSCGWNGRDMINLNTVGWHGLPYYMMFHSWYMRLRVTHRSVFKPRKSAPKRSATAVRDSVLPPPLPALPVAPLHPLLVLSAVVVRKPNSVGVVVSRQLPPPPPALPVAHYQPRHVRSSVVGRNQIVVGMVVSRRSTLRSGSKVAMMSS